MSLGSSSLAVSAPPSVTEKLSSRIQLIPHLPLLLLSGIPPPARRRRRHHHPLRSIYGQSLILHSGGSWSILPGPRNKAPLAVVVHIAANAIPTSRRYQASKLTRPTSKVSDNSRKRTASPSFELSDTGAKKRHRSASSFYGSDDGRIEMDTVSNNEDTHPHASPLLGPVTSSFSFDPAASTSSTSTPSIAGPFPHASGDPPPRRGLVYQRLWHYTCVPVPRWRRLGDFSDR
ncbi:hypothetical protein DFH09DRAFT_1320649 [Mycena vulgaris]|nr:hypothetical protein DFH09DRAFT_1320649 [Mycena vulgaris]